MTLLGFDRRDASTTLNFFRMFLRDRFLGSRLGSVWALLNPLLMFGIYTYVFGFVFKAKLPGSDTTLAYATWLIAGYGPWLALTEALNSGAQALVANRGLIKNMAFKTECLPIAASLMGLVPLAISIAFTLILLILDRGGLSWAAFAIVPGLALVFLFLAALALIFSVLNVYVRDFALVLPNLLMIVLFASPIFYPLEAMPGALKHIAIWNPFYLITEFVRAPLISGSSPPLGHWLYMGVLSACLFLVALKVFRRTKGVITSAL